MTNRALNNTYVNRIDHTINLAINEYPRVTAIRVDLRLPSVNPLDTLQHLARVDACVISRFFESLKAKLDADIARRARNGKRTYANTLRYVWAKEFNQEGKVHYHVLLLLNKDNYRYLGDYNTEGENVATRIQSAWCSALGIDVADFKHLVHFPQRGVYHLNRHASPQEYNGVLNTLRERASYLAKDATKEYSSRYRSFGCSQR